LADFSNIAPPLTIRRRQSGDIIQPLGMKEKVKLKKFIHTRKQHLTSIQRENLAVLADQNEILWVPGLGISEKIRVKNTSPVYRLNWCDIASETIPVTLGKRHILA
jgi:tRNA(Ile)-lysidine synthetase-like protein